MSEPSIEEFNPSRKGMKYLYVCHVSRFLSEFCYHEMGMLGNVFTFIESVAMEKYNANAGNKYNRLLKYEVMKVLKLIKLPQITFEIFQRSRAEKRRNNSSIDGMTDGKLVYLFEVEMQPVSVKCTNVYQNLLTDLGEFEESKLVNEWLDDVKRDFTVNDENNEELYNDYFQLNSYKREEINALIVAGNFFIVEEEVEEKKAYVQEALLGYNEEPRNRRTHDDSELEEVLRESMNQQQFYRPQNDDDLARALQASLNPQHDDELERALRASMASSSSSQFPTEEELRRSGRLVHVSRAPSVLSQAEARRNELMGISSSSSTQPMILPHIESEQEEEWSSDSTNSDVESNWN